MVSFYNNNRFSSNEYQSGPNNSYQSNYQNRKMGPGPPNRGPMSGSNQGRQMGGPMGNVNRGPQGGPNRGGPPPPNDGPSGPMGGHQRMNRGGISSEEKWDSAMGGGPNLGPPKGPNQNQGNRGNFRGPPPNSQSQMINQDQRNGLFTVYVFVESFEKLKLSTVRIATLIKSIKVTNLDDIQIIHHPK